MHYLSAQTAAPIQEILKKALLTDHLLSIISMPNSGLDNMLDLDQLEHLARLYRLYIMVPSGLPTLKRALKDSIMRRGDELNQTYGDDAFLVNEGDPKGKGKARAPATTGVDVAFKWMEDILSLKDKFDRILKNCFNSDLEVESSLNEVRKFLIIETCEIYFPHRPFKHLSIGIIGHPNIYPYLLMRTSRKVLRGYAISYISICL